MDKLEARKILSKGQDAGDRLKGEMCSLILLLAQTNQTLKEIYDAIRAEEILGFDKDILDRHRDRFFKDLSEYNRLLEDAKIQAEGRK